MNNFTPTKQQLADFQQNGFFIVEQLLDETSLDLLQKIARADRAIQDDADSRADGEGGRVDITVRNDLSEGNIYGAIVRSQSLVGTMEKILDDEVYHYHHKMVLKEALDGGAWAWHQDYGYWYNYCCLFPQLASCMIAVDRATKENGCLQVLKGSHHMGRVNHQQIGDQTGADPERVDAALERLELVHCELAPGSAVFFHCNLLHRSDQNKSPNPRWAFICCYNAARNDPFKTVRHPRYTPLEKWPNSDVVRIGNQQWASMSAAAEM